MKVIVLCQGSYSDKRVVGVFSSEQTRDSFIEQNIPQSGQERDLIREDYWWEEHEIDALKEQRTEFATNYEVVIQACNGVVIARTERPNTEVVDYLRGAVYFSYNDTIRGLSYEGMEHAHKLAVEKRQELLREKVLKPYEGEVTS